MTGVRLGTVSVIEVGTQEFAEGLADNGNWETQFKFLPLTLNPLLSNHLTPVS
jgi:hypothetical protein